MKLTVLRSIAIVLSCICGVIVLSSLRATKASAHQDKFAALYASLGMPVPEQTPAVTAAQQDLPTEQVQKNIKVLTGLPQSQLIPVMNYFAASLGRRCNFCHVNNQGQWDYAADTKPEKNTAREMIKLVLDTNKTFFKGNLEVSCYTCHKGLNHPLSVTTLPLPAPAQPPGGGQGQPRPGGPGGAAGAQPQGSPTPRPTPTPADVIIDKYVTAIGGQANIDKIKSRTIKGSTMTGGGAIPFEIYQAAPNKFYIRATTNQGVAERGFDGQVGWDKSPNGLRQLAASEVSRLQNSISLWSNLRLKEQYTRLRTGGREKIGDRDAYVVLGSRSETEVERLFFDIETGLLLRRITYMRTMIGIIPEQFDFDDYRDVDGVKLPFVVKVSSVDPGNPVSTRTYSEMKLNAAVDESKFKMPAATP
jgi:hypothetical protein